MARSVTRSPYPERKVKVVSEGSIPQAWIGEDLVLCRTGTENWEFVTLREVGEFGVVYEHKSGDVEGRPIFVPWASVAWMRPPVPEDHQDSSSEEDE